jgi:peptide/nickel transport system permease protein
MTVAHVAGPGAGHPADTATSPRRQRWLRLPRSPKILIGLALLGAFLVLAIIGPWLAPYDPSASLSTTNGVPRPPSAAHWLGTTQVQQDLWSQLLAGGRSTILVAFLSGVAATALSVVIGSRRAISGASPMTCSPCWPTSSSCCPRCRC